MKNSSSKTTAEIPAKQKTKKSTQQKPADIPPPGATKGRAFRRGPLKDPEAMNKLFGLLIRPFEVATFSVAFSCGAR